MQNFINTKGLNFSSIHISPKLIKLPSLNYSHGKHIPELDGVRGVAILSVLLFHCFPEISMFKLGWAGVDVFFVLSGFLITGILLDSVNKKNYYRNFIIKRILRIFPLYYFALFLFLFFLPHISMRTFNTLNLSFAFDHQLWYWFYISNWLLSVKTGWVHGAGINHFWSLSIEEQFYLFWPLLVYLTRRKGFIYLCILFIIASAGLRNILFLFNVPHDALYLMTISRADSLAIGGLIAALIRNDIGKRLLEYATIPAFIIVISVLSIGMFINKSANPYLSFFSTIGYTLIDLISGILIIFVLSDFMMFKNIFSLRILRFLGKYSYSMYIFHFPVMILCFYWANKFFKSSHIQNLLISTLSIFITILISLLTWYGIESRCIRLKAKIN
jgi:peptidoglycan/LPS O-acetylase OafA/YrhL